MNFIEGMQLVKVAPSLREQIERKIGIHLQNQTGMWADVLYTNDPARAARDGGDGS